MPRPTPLPRLVLAYAFTLIAFACQDAGDGRSNTGLERLRTGDTVHVHNRMPTSGDTATLRELVRIGTVEGADSLLLHDISAFVEMPDRSLIVADGSGLRRFSAEGVPLRRIARTGEGPGEVDYVVGMDVLPDGRLLAVDLGNRRINVYDLDTGELDHWSMPPGMPGYGRNSVVATGDTTAYVAINPPLPSNGDPISFPRPIFVQVSADGVGGDTLRAEARFTAECTHQSSIHWRAGFYEDLRSRYFPKVRWSLSPMGDLAVGCSADYSFDVIRPDGSVLRISREWAPVRVTDEERDFYVEGQTQSRTRMRPGSWSWRGPEPPGRKPAYQRMFFGERGRLWVWPAHPSVREETPRRFREAGAPPAVYRVASTGAFDVFDREGRYLGPVRLPDGVRYSPFPGRADPYVRGDTMWAVRYDELDVPYLTKFAIEWPAERATGANDS